MIRVLVVIMMVLGLMFAAPSPAYADLSNTEYERATRLIINEYHAPDLKRNECVDGYAERHAKRLDVTNSFYHQDVGRIFRDCNGQAAGEIIARGFATPREVVKAWLNSDGHRAVMLNQRWDFIGVGARHTPKGRLVVVTFLDR